MSNLILVRHGQSKWNAENKFTGWVDVSLSDKGKFEAAVSGQLIKKLNIPLKYTFVSLLSRAKETLEIILNEMNSKYYQIYESWELNERHYGSLTGLNKKETELKIGKKLFKQYRRSWDISPPKITSSKTNLQYFKKYKKKISIEKIPLTESLKDTYDRVIPYFKKNILPLIKNNNDILLVAHGNSLRALCKNLFKIENNGINDLEIPTGNPLHVVFNSSLEIIKANYLDKNRERKIFFDRN